MEKRLIAAIVLSAVVLIGYQLLFMKSKPVEQPQVTAPQTAAPAASGPQAPGAGRLPLPAVKAKAEPVEKAAAPQTAVPQTAATAGQEKPDIVVETPLYTATWSNHGAVLKSWVLKKYLNDKKQPVDLVPAKSNDVGLYPFSLMSEDGPVASQLNDAFFDAAVEGEAAQSGQTETVRFSYSDGKSISAEKVLRFKGGTYQVEIEVKVWKNGQEIPASVLWGPGIGNPSPAELKQRYTASMGSAVYTGGKVYRMAEKAFKLEQSSYNFVSWAAYEDHYFAALFVPPAQSGTAVFHREEASDKTPVYFLSVSQPQLAFIGPKDSDALKAFGHDAKDVINFGGFLGINLKAIAEVMLGFVKYIHNFVPNWGFAIILLTVVIKIIFFPLTYSSTKSMAKMADLAPKVKAIRAKYKKSKSDIAQRKQMNEEMMDLYKKNGVNPAGGCLPLLIQMPIFIGVYQMLLAAVEFRRAPLGLWIKDLAAPDPIWALPILMGITQFISQKMTPTSADPSQAKMMLIMPVIMTFFFLSFPSGLVLYWLTTNVLQIGQQALMNRMIARKKRESDGKR
jgi:YidC/Oxa1 family membrane protein insertase